MRQRRVAATAGKLNSRLPFSRELLVIVALVAAAAWMAYTFAQEAYLSHRLGQQATAMREENAALQAQNDRYRHDILAMASGAAAEEEARLNGYARRDEKVYLVSGPQPKVAPASKSVAKVEGEQKFDLRRWLFNLWNR
jgi:cell division protein FtsB